MKQKDDRQNAILELVLRDET